MPEAKPCVCLAMLIADKVIREEQTHKVYILGTFSNLISRQYPTVHDTMHLYLALTDALPGEHRGRVHLVYIDEGPGLEESELLRMEGPLAVQDKLQVLECNMVLRKVRFPRPGVLDLRFYLDDVFVASRQFRAIQQDAASRPGPPGPHA